MLDEIGSQVAQGAGEYATETIHKRWGWKGCLLTFVLVAGLIGGTIYLLAR